jgi:hypothetical protein
MLPTSHPLTRLVVGVVVLLFPSALLRADGGVVRLREQAGPYQVTVFTSPTPFRAGPVDISVLVQNASSGQCVTEMRITVHLTSRTGGRVLEVPATTEAATNKLLHAAVFELPQPGWWEVEITIEAADGPAVVRFGVQAEEPAPRWLELWPWFAWPVVVVVLFAVHQVLVRRRNGPAPTGSGTHRDALAD